MTRQQYADHLRQQASSLLTIADCIEEHGIIEAYDWQVEMPIMTKFDEEVAAQEQFNAEHIAAIEGREVA